MTAALGSNLAALGEIVREFGLRPLLPALLACEALAVETGVLDVAVFGQFKAGKSSLLNALLGADLFPVGAVPVTAVITRATGGPALAVRVSYQNGSAEEVSPEQIREFVTESGNPGNRRGVSVVDVSTPALSAWPGIRLVDTPGLGSVFLHNTKATEDWLPSAAAALVVVSAERPLSGEDRRLVAEARHAAPRVWVVVTKVDLLSAGDLDEVLAFVGRELFAEFGEVVPVISFSTKTDRSRWAENLKQDVLRPLSTDLAGERRRVLNHKMLGLEGACREYLEVAVCAAERTAAERENLSAAGLTESERAEVILDELRLAEQSIRAAARPAFEKHFLTEHAALHARLRGALSSDVRTWRGNLAQQVGRYEKWLGEKLHAELAPLSLAAASRAAELLRDAELRYRRVVEAFRDRVSRNLSAALGVTLSPVHWEPRRPEVTVLPVSVGKTFDTQWDLLWWLLPMPLVGGLFRRHLLGLLPWEAEKNLHRLVSDWSEVVFVAAADLRREAYSWVEAELETLRGLLSRRPDHAAVLRYHLGRIAGPADFAATT